MSAEEFTGLGFAPGSVKGVRSFRVDKFGRLTGIHYRQVWRPEENVAECRKDEGPSGVMGGIYTGLMSASGWSSLVGGAGGAVPQTVTFYADTHTKRGRGKGHVVSVQKQLPEPPAHTMADCQCGFYGYFDGSDDYHDNGTVSAVVEAYGETIIGTRGFRAMKAKIVALHINDKDLSPAFMRKIRNNYDGIAFFDSFESMVAEFPPDLSLEPSPKSDPSFWEREA